MTWGPLGDGRGGGSRPLPLAACKGDWRAWRIMSAHPVPVPTPWLWRGRESAWSDGLKHRAEGRTPNRVSSIQ